MPEKATVAFWRDIPAIEKSKVFRPDALPEAYIRNAPTDDERYFVPITETVSSRPLWISPQRNHVAYEHQDPMRVFFNVKARSSGWATRASRWACSACTTTSP